MVGKVSVGKSFRGCLNYLFEGRKHETTEEQKQAMEKRQVQVIDYNYCFGNKKELVQQFIEVSRLNPKVGNSVFHCSLSLAPADSGRLDQQDKADLAAKLAQTFGIQNNQYVVIAHRDTKHEHLHIVANRIGYDGKTASDSNSYKRMAEYCRQMEREYKLEKMLSPNKFLAPEQKVAQSQRIDQRKEQLKQHLSKAIKQCKHVQEVKRYMEDKGFKVELARGIAFTDRQHVYFKGSQVGFSLQTIEQKLVKEQQLRQEQQRELKRQQELKQQQKEQEKQQKLDRSQKLEQSQGIKYYGGISI
jgi:hypothetical protein